MSQEINPTLKARIEDVREEGLLAFWAKVAEKFPEATSGDIDPPEVWKQDRDSESIIASWLRNNAPSLFPPEVDSPEWFNEIAQKLVRLGYEAEAENTGGGIICIGVSVGKYRLMFGTANETWGFDVYDCGDFSDDLSNEYSINPALQMTLPSEEPDPEKCAVAIANTVDVFKRDRAEAEAINLGVRVL